MGKVVDISTFRQRRGLARGPERRQGGTVIKEGRRWREMKRTKRGKEGKMLKLREKRRVPAARCVARRCAASAIRAKLMQRHAADILENPWIYSGACNAATMKRIHCFYSASRMRIYEACHPLLSFSRSIRVLNRPGSPRGNLRNETAGTAICAYRGYYLGTETGQTSAGAQGSLGN